MRNSGTAALFATRHDGQEPFDSVPGFEPGFTAEFAAGFDFEPGFEHDVVSDADFSAPFGARHGDDRESEGEIGGAAAGDAVAQALGSLRAVQERRSRRERLLRPERLDGDERVTRDELQSRIGSMQDTGLDSRALPTLDAVSTLLPGGALKQGAAYSVEGSMTLAMAMLAGPSADGSWCGVVGVPDFGAEAASRLGIDLSRLVLVPHPGDDWLAVTGALVDVLTVVIARPPARASDSSVARLGARLRQRGAALIVLGSWPQSEATIRVHDNRWSGLGTGHGYIGGRQATLDVTGRGGVTHARGVRMWLPAPDESVRPLTELEESVVDREHRGRARPTAIARAADRSADRSAERSGERPSVARVEHRTAAAEQWREAI